MSLFGIELSTVISKLTLYRLPNVRRASARGRARGLAMSGLAPSFFLSETGHTRSDSTAFRFPALTPNRIRERERSEAVRSSASDKRTAIVFFHSTLFSVFLFSKDVYCTFT